MEQNYLEKAKLDIDEALKLIEDMEIVIDEEDSSKDILKEKFSFLSKKLQELEELFKNEGII